MTAHHDPCHHGELPRLNRIGGQMSGVRKMIEEHRECPEILNQLRAIRAAIKGLEASILDRHLNHCLTETIKEGERDAIDRRLVELKDLFKRYDD